MQRTAGNAALARLLPTVQRDVSYRGTVIDNLFHAKKKLDDDREALIAAVDKATKKARKQILARPMFTGLDALVDADGHVALWVENWADGVKLGYYPGKLAAEYGYAVESLTTHVLGKSAAGWTLTYQIAAGATRPDIVATKGPEVTWLDLTASASAGHIYSLKSWHSPFVCPCGHAEITYPSMDGGAQSVMLANAKLEAAGTPLVGKVDAAQLEQQIKAAQALRAARLEDWRARYVDKFKDDVLSVAKRGKILTDGDVLARKDTVTWLNKQFPGANLNPLDKDDLRTAASVLEVLGIVSVPYGFHVVTTSKARGVAFLETYDPKLLTA